MTGLSPKHLQGRIDALRRLESGKQEAKLKADFGKELALQLPGFVMLSYATAGGPDRTILGHGRQTNWEMKHATPDFVSPGRQELICMRMAGAGHCRYVIWYEHDGMQQTMIVHPRMVHFRTGWNLEAEAWCIGFNHRWLVDQIRQAHGL